MMNNTINIEARDYEGLTDISVYVSTFMPYVEVTATLPSGKRTSVTAHGADPAGLGSDEPTVNWSALGSTSVADAIAYANLIRCAAAIVSS